MRAGYHAPMPRSWCLWVLTGAALPAQESRPAAEPFVRVLTGTTRSPWPEAQEPLWVVTADPFVLDAGIGYHRDTATCMELLHALLAATRDVVDRSDWAKQSAREWEAVRVPLGQVLDAWARASRGTDDPTNPGRASAIQALRDLTVKPAWHTPPVPVEALDASLRMRWQRFHDLVVALWGDTETGGFEGWLVRAARGRTEPELQGHPGLLPRIADRLAGAAGNEILAAPQGTGPEGVFTTAARTDEFLLRALARLQADRRRAPSVRHALYRCITCLLEETAWLRQNLGIVLDAPATGLLGDKQWLGLRTASAAGALAVVRFADQSSLVTGAVLGKGEARRSPCRVLLLISPAMAEALDELEQAGRRAVTAWAAFTGRRIDDPLLTDRVLGFDGGLVRQLRAAHAGETPGRWLVLRDISEHRRLRWQLAGWKASDFPGVTVALTDARTAQGIPAGSWLLQPLRTEGLRPVEFRVRVGDSWQWGRGAMADCALKSDLATTPLHELWHAPSAR
jgi:hypothetical protein